LRCPELTINRPFQKGWKNILPQHNPGFMRVIKMGRSRFGKIDPKKEKPRNSENSGYTTTKPFWVAGN
jgi:hypothetical protein